MTKAVSLGIVGTGRIANRFVPEAEVCGGVALSGVYNPRLNSAAQFGERHDIPAFDDFDRFLSGCDAVYIASPHETHYDYTVRALNAGKHVLCEKPLALHGREAAEMFALSERKGRVLMEALKTAYCPGFRRVVDLAKSGRIGRIVSVDAVFTKLVPPGSRELRGPAAGSVTELASYPLLAVFSLLGINYHDVRFVSCCEDTGVDLFTRIELSYPSAMASARVGVGVKSEGSLVISGTAGYIYVPAPWWKTERFELRFEDPGAVEKFSSPFAGDGLRYELDVFLEHVRSGRGDIEMDALSRTLADVIAHFRDRQDVLFV